MVQEYDYFERTKTMKAIIQWFKRHSFTLGLVFYGGLLIFGVVGLWGLYHRDYVGPMDETNRSVATLLILVSVVYLIKLIWRRINRVEANK